MKFRMLFFKKKCLNLEYPWNRQQIVQPIQFTLMFGHECETTNRKFIEHFPHISMQHFIAELIEYVHIYKRMTGFP